MSRLVLIAAVALNGVIGKTEIDQSGEEKYALPWEKIDEDTKHFVKLTKGHPVIMGRKTYFSIPKKYRPLRGRPNLVVTSEPEAREYEEGVMVFNNLPRTIQKASELDDLIYVAGGGEIYEQTMPLASGLEITEIHRSYGGDVKFPFISETKWREVSRLDHWDKGFSFVTYELREESS